MYHWYQTKLVDSGSEESGTIGQRCKLHLVLLMPYSNCAPHSGHQSGTVSFLAVYGSRQGRTTCPEPCCQSSRGEHESIQMYPVAGIGQSTKKHVVVHS